jgi:hypothetical protein
MQEVAVRHAVRVLHSRGVDFATAKCVDVGGSRLVFLVRAETERQTSTSTVLNRLRRTFRGPTPPAPICEVTRNPILDVFANVTLIDHGFTGQLLDTGSDLKGDFLDDVFVRQLRHSFDVVLSFDTLEHVEDPFRFCRNLVEIAAPGGHIYVQTVFSWEYHPSPQDYFRYSPEGLKLCLRDVPATILDAGWVVDEVSTFALVKKAAGCA